MSSIAKILCLTICTLLSLAANAQQQQRLRVKIERADVLRHDDKIGKNTQSLNGNVILSHGRTFLHCDSAYMYNDSNCVVAYSNVHVIQNDSIHLYGNKITYFGDQNLAKVRENVRANKGDTWLYTEHLDYDNQLDKAYFYNGGKVVNKENTLTSINGIYFPNYNDVYFEDSVHVTSPKYVMDSDTMKFNTVTEVVTIMGPTTIVNTDSTIILSDDGWYDTKTDIAELNNNSTIISKQSTLRGKKILYERRKNLGTVWGNMQLTDSANNMQILGDYGFANEITGAAFATRNAQLLQVYNGDSLFMHADTFQIVPLPEDTSRLIKAYYAVKFFRTDMQGRCDSLVFDFRDSIGTMYNVPIIWAQGNQMTANEIKLHTRNQVLYKTELIESAFCISPEITTTADTIGYNQIKGKLLTGHIRNNDLYRIDVDGNGQTIYYPKDDDTLIGLNRAESSNMTIWLEDRKISNITMRSSPAGNLNPPILIGEKDKKLAGFRWFEPFRPKNKFDIFKPLEITEDLIYVGETYEGFTFDALGE